MKDVAKRRDQDLIDDIRTRWQDLKNQRNYHIDTWRDVSKYISPYNGRFNVHNHSYNRDYRYIFDNHAGRALQILVSGIASSSTSPMRSWFTLTVDGRRKSEEQSDEVDQYLANVKFEIEQVLQSSGIYASLHQLYKEVCLFGVGACLIYPDEKKLMKSHVLTAGEYCIDVDEYNNVNTLYREFDMTTAQAVREFGLANLSKSIKDAYENGRLEEYHTFIHAIEPRTDRNINSKEAVQMPYQSIYVELANENSTVLRESGFEYFPALCPRFEVLGSDPYGESPCIKILPDVKQLQHVVQRKEQALEIDLHPPLMAPANARQNPIQMSPDSVNYVTSDYDQIKPIMQRQLYNTIYQDDIDRLHEAIDDGLYKSSFMPVIDSSGTRKTATEVNQMKQEQIMILGMFAERCVSEVGERVVEIAYTLLSKAGMIDEPPNELVYGGATGMSIQFEGMFAQAQRSININSYDRYIATMQSVSASVPTVIDLLNADELMRDYASMLALPDTIMNKQSEVDEIRQQRAQQQQQQAQQEQKMQAIELASKFSGKDLGAIGQMAQQGGDVFGQSQETLDRAQSLAPNASQSTQSLEPYW